MVEQLIHFMLAASFAVAFLSMFVATLFGFFIRTEPIAWSSLEMVIELFIQTLVNSLLMSLVVGFVLIGANSGNAILLLGGALAGLFMAWNLMQGTLKGLMNATERLYRSFASATGGNFATVSETTESMGSAAVSAATGAAVLAGGGSFLQAAGGAFGDARTAQTMNYASRMLGGEDTLLGRAAEAVGEGASARTMGGPVGGALLGAQNRRNRQDEDALEARLIYKGDADAARIEALQTYRNTNDRDDLNAGFDDDDARRVGALTLAYGDDQVDALATAARRVRNANPDLSPDSSAFQRQLRDELPPDLQNIETAALGDAAAVFGRSADPTPSRYDKATALMQPIPTPGPADEARDDALRAYRLSGDEGVLTDAFSPDDANRVARLMDAYDDDDFAAVISAVRAARDADPDVEPGSSRALTAARNELPPSLAQMPSSDLRAFSNAFGASATTPAVIQPEATAPAIYVGDRDGRRDRALAAYRASGDETDLYDDFSPLGTQQVMQLNDEYDDDDFDAVVRAVRQVRTDDPDLEAGSTPAVRAARRQLPDRLRQMPSGDLFAFSAVFGAEADTPTVGQSTKLPPKPPPTVEPVPLTQVLDADEAHTVAFAFGHDVDAEDLVIYPNQAVKDNAGTLPRPAAPTRPAPPAPQTQTGAATQPLPTQEAAPPPNGPLIYPPPRIPMPAPFPDDDPAPERQPDPAPPRTAAPPSPAPPPPADTPLTRISGIGPATQTQLRAAGIETVEDLAQADPAKLAELPRITSSRAQAWVTEAGMMTAPPVPPAAPPPARAEAPSPVATPSVGPDAAVPATPPPVQQPAPPRDYSNVTPSPIQQPAPPPAPPVRPQSVDDGPPPPRDYSQVTPPPVQQPTPPPAAPIRPEAADAGPPLPRDYSQATPPPVQQSAPPPPIQQAAPSPPAAPVRPQSLDDGPPPPRDYRQVTPPPVQQAAPPPPVAPVRPQSVDGGPPPRDYSQVTPPASTQPTQGSPTTTPAAPVPQRRVETPVAPQQPTAAPPTLPTEGAPTPPQPTQGVPTTPPPAAPAPQRRVETPVAPQPPSAASPPPPPAAPAPQRRVETPVTPQPSAAPPPPPPAAPSPQRRVETPVTPQPPTVPPEQKPPDPLAGQSDGGDA